MRIGERAIVRVGAERARHRVAGATAEVALVEDGDTPVPQPGDDRHTLGSLERVGGRAGVDAHMPPEALAGAEVPGDRRDVDRGHAGASRERATGWGWRLPAGTPTRRAGTPWRTPQRPPARQRPQSGRRLAARPRQRQRTPPGRS